MYPFQITSPSTRHIYDTTTVIIFPTDIALMNNIPPIFQKEKIPFQTSSMELLSVWAFLDLVKWSVNLNN